MIKWGWHWDATGKCESCNCKLRGGALYWYSKKYCSDICLFAKQGIGSDKLCRAKLSDWEQDGKQRS
ncbi:MAG: hypothetical protein FWF56_03575 [Firmicutes bacterium]|nr:hypothetical protein [Bacillota bacterium]